MAWGACVTLLDSQADVVLSGTLVSLVFGAAL